MVVPADGCEGTGSKRQRIKGLERTEASTNRIAKDTHRNTRRKNNIEIFILSDVQYDSSVRAHTRSPMLIPASGLPSEIWTEGHRWDDNGSRQSNNLLASR